MEHLFNRKQPRTLVTRKGEHDFSSNDYLGLARSAELYENIREAYSSLPNKRNGSTGSRLLTGNSQLAEETEAFLASYFGGPAALLFDSGYMANLAVLSALPQRGDTIIYDEHAHASIKDGARLSLATRWSFAHNDMDELRRKLRKARGHKWIVVESLYSMDGTYCPLKEICATAKEWGAFVVVDEAHSTGTTGLNGSGLAAFMGVAGLVDVRIHTFGKAMGIHGACVAGSRELVRYLVNFSRPLVYTTAPDDHTLVGIRKSFEYLSQHPELMDALRQSVDSFVARRRQLNATFLRSESQIQGLVIPGDLRVREVASRLNQKGFDVRPIVSPTVKEGTERLRICLHTYNSAASIKELLDAIEEEVIV